MDSIDRIIKTIEGSLHSCQTKQEISKYIKLNHQNITLLNKKLKTVNTIYEKQTITSKIAILRTLETKQKHRLKRLDTHHGHGLRNRAASVTNAGATASKKTDRIEWKEVQSAFESRIRTGVIINLTHIDPLIFLQDCSSMIISRIKNALKKFDGIKMNLTFCGEFLKVGLDEEKDFKYMNTKNIVILRGTAIEEGIEEIYGEILSKLDDFQEKNSGWALLSIAHLLVCFVKYNPLRAGSSTFLEIPPSIRTKRQAALLNIRNLDNRCFFWCLQAHFHPARAGTHAVSPNSYPQNNEELNFSGIEFPVQIKDIVKFEKQNNISINVYGINDSDDIFPLYHSKNILADPRHVNLLFIQNHFLFIENNDYTGHYILIKDLGKLCHSQLSKDNNKKFVCSRCLCFFNSKDRLDSHFSECSLKGDLVKIALPDESESILKFKHFKATMRVPFCIYADFEALTTPTDTCNPSPELSYMNLYQHHVPFAVGYKIVCSYDATKNRYESYRGPNPGAWFVKQIFSETEIISEILKNHQIVPMTISNKQQMEHDSNQVCSICDSEFSDDNQKVRHHDHYTGLFISTLCNNCNLQCKVPKILPILLHNGSKYDNKFIIEEFANMHQEHSVQLIPTTAETYISFTKYHSGVQIRFLDSFRFLPSSLDKISSNLTREQLHYTNAAFTNPEDFNLMTAKGIFPYDYVNSWARLDETKLPEKSEFYSILTESGISDENYTHALKVFDHFNCKTIGEYADLYLKSDVHLLADIFENYRNLTMGTYGLDSASFFTAPGLSFAAALKMSKQKLQLLTDVDSHFLFQNGLRGGSVQCSQKYAISNCPYSHNFKPEEVTTEVVYMDCNGLYSDAMLRSLPFGHFRFLNDDELSNIQNLLICKNFIPIESLYGDSLPKSCILEVDIHYPDNIHNEHSDFPFCPQHISHSGKKADRKLMLTLYDKDKYVLHLDVLLQCLKHGLVLKKVHRAIEFSHSKWLKKFIDLNSTLRAQATNAFDKQQYKDMSNMTFGKLMECVDKYRKIILVTSWKSAERFLAKPNFLRTTIFNENLVAIEMRKDVVKYDKPAYIGMCVLDLSKTVMYSFMYDYLKVRVSPYFDITLMYTDTDSMVLKFIKRAQEKFRSIYDLIREDAHLIFDTSDYSEDNPYCIPRVNKKIVGKFKDEMCGKIISEFIGLRAKVYTIKTVDDETKFKKLKGIGRSAVRKLTFADYFETLFDDKQKMCTFNSIRSIKQQLYSVKINKMALSNYDDKRCLIKGSSINTLPWGHWKLIEN